GPWIREADLPSGRHERAVIAFPTWAPEGTGRTRWGNRGMSVDWDFYLCRVDGDPASIFVDLGLARDAPVNDRPHMAYVRVYMQSPRPDGLSSQEEFDALVRLENSLTSALSADNATIYVGRNTSGGCRDFYFYTD